MTKASGEGCHGRCTPRTLVPGGAAKAGAPLEGEAAGRRAGTGASVPTPEQFAGAFARLAPKIKDHHWRMLEALLGAPGGALTASELAAAAGYRSHVSANAMLGTLARMVAQELGYRPDRRADSSPIWTMTLATGVEAGVAGGDKWRWRMRPEVVDYLDRMGVGRGPRRLPATAAGAG